MLSARAVAAPLLLSDGQRDWLQQHGPIRVGVMTGWPPISFIDQDGNYNGVSAGYLAAINQRLDGRVIPVPGTWNQLREALDQGRIDALMDLTPNVQRRQKYAFTRLYLNIPHVIVARRDQPYLESEDDLLDKTLALERGFGNVEDFQRQYPQVRILTYADTSHALGAVARGEADAYVGNRTVAAWLIEQELMSNLRMHGRAIRFSSRLAIGVRNEQRILASILELALADMSLEEQRAIQRRWVDGEAEQRTSPEATAGLYRQKKFLEQLSERERQWLVGHPVIRLASDNNWLPFEAIDSQGRHQGIAAEYLDLIEQRLGVDFVLSPVRPWDEILHMVERRELDLLSCAMATEDRMRYARFTRPFISNPMVIVTRDDIDYVDGAEGLRGKRVAVEKGYASYELLTTRHPELELLAQPDSVSALRAVVGGTAYAYIGNIANASHVIREHGLTNLKISGQLPYQFELAMGVRSDWPELVSILQKALDSISAAEKTAIHERWVGVTVPEGVDWALMQRILLILGAAIVLILAWNLALKRKVRERTEQLQYQAHYDALTGLPNRVLALDRLQYMLVEAQRHGSRVAVLFLDLDDFKRVNDNLGHDTGDKLLVQLAARLKSALRGNDTVGRLGGDEFMVLVGDLAEPMEATPVAESLLASLAEPFLLEGRELVLTASVGIAVYPDDSASSGELLRKADSAMYHAKQSGRDAFSFFTEAMNEELAQRLQLEEQIHGALARGEFEVHYQPQIDIASGRLDGFEALLRWHNPQLGAIPPAAFIPIAEHTGVIVPLGMFVLREAAAAIAGWNRLLGRELTIAVNLSPRQFRCADLAGDVGGVLRELGIDSRRVELEITEGLLISGHESVARELQELKRLGVSIAMDDFGIGYSSLSYLRNHPFDTLKIDREFINEVTRKDSDKELVRAAIAMAHALGLKVVAEGVETESQLQVLRELECDIAQGYFYSRPVPADQVPALLQRFG